MAEPLAESLATRPSGGAEHAFEFRGTGGEYFRIWIVNFFLTLVTLGIYSAWAKVRTERYFASSTLLDGASFAYLANPISILKGRALVLGFLLLSASASAISPFLEPFLGLLVVMLIPWAIVQSLAFRAHNTAWRNLRFTFRAPYGAAFNAYMALPLLGAITFGVAYPYAVYRQRRLLIDGASFGTTPFQMASQSGAFYRIFATIGLMLVLAGILAAGTFFFASEAGAIAVAVAAIPLYFYVFGYYSSQIANATYDGLRIGEHTLVSRVPAAGLASIYLTNALAMLVSLGVLVPWARVRVVRFRLEHMRLRASGSLEDFVAAQAEEVGSLGAEIGDALDFDLGL